MSDHTPQRATEPSGTEAEHVDDVVIYGDFSCPFSALAFRRATRRAERDAVPFVWRSVEHDPEVPVDGVLLDAEGRAGFDAELAQIRGLLTDDENDDQHVPTHRLNTARLNVLAASLPPSRRGEFAQAVFDAYWRDGRNLNDPAEVERLGVSPTDEGARLAPTWQAEWESFDRRIVPMMRLADGELSRGLGALSRLR